MADSTEIRTHQPNAELDEATLEWIDRFAPYGVLATDRELRIRSWNCWLEKHSGFAEKDVLGRKITEVYPDLAKRRLIPQFERALQGEVSVISTALHGWLLPLKQVARDIDFPHMKQTARVAPLTTHNQIYGVIVIIEDVTQREWQAEILARQHARDEILAWALAHLLKAEDPRRVTRDVFCKVAEHLDFDSYLLHMFDAKTDTLKLHSTGGVDPGQEEAVRTLAVKSFPWIVDSPEGHAVVRENVQSSMDPLQKYGKALGFRAYLVLPLITASSLLGTFCVATRTRDTISPRETELLGTIGQYLAVALNREKIDRELREAQRKLNAHAQELEQNVADRTASLKQIIAELQTFSYTIAHDLRAPIRALKGYCEVLVEDYADNLPADANVIVGRLRNASMQMDALTRDLLEFSKVSRQDLSVSAIDLSQIIADTIAMGGSRLSSCVSVKHPLHEVLGNRTLVGQCVSNLVENALKFCRPGIQPVVKIWSELIAASPDAKNSNTSQFSRSRYSLADAAEKFQNGDIGRVRLWFEDNGIGISREAQGKIFGIFERGEQSGQFEGTGIGLAIVARAMERMGGACGVESTHGQGSCFWLEFQAAPSLHAEPAR
ncbi:MAG: ATP-binding protein [Limisphaerales bacterium]